MHPFLLSALLALPQASAPQAPPAQAEAPAFLSETRPFVWNEPIAMNLSLSGLQVSTLAFSREKVEPGFFDVLGAPEVTTRVKVTVTNTSRLVRRVAFALAVENKDGKLLGAVSTGRKLDKLYPDQTEVFELRFTLMKDEVPKGERFKFVFEPRAE